jgi:hypothetical protein
MFFINNSQPDPFQIMKALCILFLMVWCMVAFSTGNDSHDFKIFVKEGFSSVQEVTDLEELHIKDASQFFPIQEFKGSIGHMKFYWLFIKPGFADTASIFSLSLNERFSKIELYPYPFSHYSSQSGLTVPLNQKSLSGTSVILNAGSGPFLVKVENRFQVLFKVDDIRVQTIIEYLKIQKRKNLFLGYTQGFFWLMLLYNLVLFLIARRKVHLYYVLYILFNALFLMTTSGLADVYLFPGQYWFNLILLTFQLLGVIFYVLFLRTAMLGHCTAYTPEADKYLLKPFAILILALNTAI